MILADGARWDLFQRLIQAGELKNISSEVCQAGGIYKAVTSFPSTTGPAYMPFLTGCHPGTCNVPGIRWFDKRAFGPNGRRGLSRFRSYVGPETFFIGKDMSEDIQTIFEILPRSFSIFSSLSKGARWRDLTRVMRIWYVYYAHMTEHWTLIDEAALAKACRAIEKDFQFLFVVFPGIDEHSHLAHPHHEKTLERYDYVDRAIGELIRRLKSLGKWDSTLFFIVSDHGLTLTHTHFCVNQFMEGRGLKPFYYPKILGLRSKNVANMMSGNAMTHLYFKNGHGWAGATARHDVSSIDSNLMNDLVAHPAIDILMARNEEGGVDIFSERGEAKLKWIGDQIGYDAPRADPFGYGLMPSQMSPEEAMQKTWESSYPDALWQILKLFNSPRSGDVVLSAAPGFDLRLRFEVPEHRGSHGSLHAEHMFVPVITNVKLPSRPFRTLDLFPTLLNLLGKKYPEGIDGKGLITVPNRLE